MKQSYLNTIFENRNKKYGAYILRKKYDKNVIIAFAIASIIVLTAFAIPLVLKILELKQLEKEPLKVETKKIVNYSHLAAPPPIELQPPPKKVEIKPQKATVKYVKPVVKPDEEVVEEIEIPTNKELKSIDPGFVDIEGFDSIVYDEVTIEPPPPKQEPVLFAMVEKQPEFPGGTAALLKYYANNIIYPDIAKEYSIQGRVIIQFTIDVDGSVTDVIILKDIGAGCGEEAVRVTKLMANWSPAEQNGKNVPVKMVVPVLFKLKTR